MGYYFSDFLSVRIRNSANVRSTLRTVAGRYIGENPPSGPIFKLVSDAAPVQESDYRYVFDLSRQFPDAKHFSIIYAWASLYSETERKMSFSISIDGPCKVYLNGNAIFTSHIGHERTTEQRYNMEGSLTAGWNTFVLEFTCTPRGFGGTFGTANRKSAAFMFMGPSAETEDWCGWLYTPPLSTPLSKLPEYGQSEVSTGVLWLPEREWPQSSADTGNLARIFGIDAGHFARSWTKGDFRCASGGDYTISLTCSHSCSLRIAGKEVFSTQKEGTHSFTAYVPYGIQDIVADTQCGKKSWHFEMSVSGASGPVDFSLPVALVGRSGDRWLHSGPFAEPLASAVEATDLRRPLHTARGESYYRIDRPGVFIRPFFESGNFGRWSYPLGVTLYGLLVAGRILESADIELYAQEHLQMIADWYEYALWDGASYGAASILHHLFELDTLDDCGSGGSSLLEAVLRVGLENFKPLADAIATHILDVQERLPDGAFYRNKIDNPFMAGTLWSDDLYMSVPFLIRYWRVSSDNRCLEDSINQFRLYSKYLMIEKHNVLSHVYDVTASLANNVPWGRGNGWAMFSLTELLTILPADHPSRSEMMALYRRLAYGFRALQDPCGMWHQILTDHESYPEASCTSMFLYSFSRGLRLGWLSGEEFAPCVHAAWQSLCSNSVDYHGNVYGICRGSGFSFTEKYYRDELGWILNDLHGIGIILLAGAEYLNLEQNRSNWKG